LDDVEPLHEGMKPVVVVMGVASSGKSSIGLALSLRCGIPFVEGDSLHPEANIARMSSGLPLDDAHRRDWLDRIAAVIADAEPGAGLILTCSALKRGYRDRLASAGPRVVFLNLSGSRTLIETRMAERKGHFMPLSLLDSQFTDFEPPAEDENVVTVDVAAPLDEVVETAVHRLGLACQKAPA
jgi:gluconokinase